MASPRRLSTTQDYDQLFDQFDTWLFDCDGVLWNGMTLIDGAREVLQLLRSKKKKVIFVTNNASTSRSSFKKKFDQLGIVAYMDEIFGSAYVASVYLSTLLKFPKEKKVFVIGMKGLEEELEHEGIGFVGGTECSVNTLATFDPTTYVPSPSVGAVLCGFDSSINYTKLSKAFVHLNTDPECLFLATNVDSTAPSEGGIILPAGGAISAPLRYALGRDPLVLGKPSQIALECIKAKHNFDPKRAIIVGDRLDTDILFGKQGGLSTLLVLSGVSKKTDLLPDASPPVIPDYILNSISDLMRTKKL